MESGKFKFIIYKFDNTWHALAAPKGWSNHFYRWPWRTLIALVTFPLYIAGDRFGWRHIYASYRYGDDGKASCENKCYAYARGHMATEYEYDPYSIILEEELKKSERLFKDSTN